MKKLLILFFVFFAQRGFSQDFIIKDLGQIHNDFLSEIRSKDLGFKSKQDLNNYCYDYLSKRGINLSDDDKRKLDDYFNSISPNPKEYNLYSQLLNSYEQNKSKNDINLTENIDKIFKVFNSTIESFSIESNEEFENYINGVYGSLAKEIENSDKLTIIFKDKLLNMIEIAKASSAYWHANPPKIEENVAGKRWWQYVGEFVGADIAGAGATMQVCPLCPPGLHGAAAVLASGYTAYCWGGKNC